MKTEHLSSDQQRKCEALSLPRTVSYGLLGAIWSIVRQTCPVKRAVIGYRREGLHFEEKSCADPESFVRGGPTFLFFYFVFRGERGSKQIPLNRASSARKRNVSLAGSQAKRHLNGVSLAGRG